jgi:hypothetical protein
MASAAERASAREVEGSDGALNVTGGALTRNGSGHLVLGSYGGSHGTINQSGGLIDLRSGDLEVGVFENSTGTFKLLPGTAGIDTHGGIVNTAILEGSQDT